MRKSYAIPDVLKRAGLTTKDVDVYEINEAFASQAGYCINKLGLGILFSFFIPFF